MNTKKGMTQIAAESDGESENEIVEAGNQNNIKIVSHKIMNNKRFRIASISFCVFIAMIVAVFIVFALYDISGLNNKHLNKDEASNEMENLMKLNTSYDDFTDDEQSTYAQSFDVFDENGDGYLNQTEFANYFELELLHSAEFQTMDVDSDGILSFAECVAYIYEMDKIEEIHERFLKQIANQIKFLYGYDSANIATEDELAVFLEYVAMFMYFIPFDSDSNGYIHYDEYLLKSSEMEFDAIDRDQNSKISLNELGQTIYGINNGSWTNNLQEIFGDDKYEDVLSDLHQIKITKEMVQNVNDNLGLCPQQINVQQNEDTKRRLGLFTRYACCYYVYSCNIASCYKDWYCYHSGEDMYCPDYDSCLSLCSSHATGGCYDSVC